MLSGPKALIRRGGTREEERCRRFGHRAPREEEREPNPMWTLRSGIQARRRQGGGEAPPLGIRPSGRRREDPIRYGPEGPKLSRRCQGGGEAPPLLVSDPQGGGERAQCRQARRPM